MGARLLLVYLADHFNEDEGAAWPSQHRLAGLMGCTDRAIRKWLTELTEAGILSSQMRSGTSNLYRITLEHGSGVPRNKVPPTPERHSANPGTRFRLTNKEPIKEKPADPETVRATIDQVRAELRQRGSK
jgi:DNA-binding transcriptional ArsR family regulator